MFWDDFRENYRETGLCLFRVVFGFLFLLHGLMKFGVMSEMSFGALPMAMKIAGIIEVTTGILLILGLYTTWAAFIASGQMAVTYWWQHAFSAGAANFWNPLANGGELAAIFAFAFLLIWFMGPTKCSLDQKMQ